jgi:hypothetical protein
MVESRPEGLGVNEIHWQVHLYYFAATFTRATSAHVASSVRGERDQRASVVMCTRLRTSVFRMRLMGKLGDIEEAQNVAEQSGQLEFLDTAKPRSHYFWRRSRLVSQKSPL